MAEIIKGAQTLETIEKALKENYLNPFRNGLSTEPSALLGQIKKVKLTSNEIVATAPQGLSGGFGFGAEGHATPQAGNVIYERFKTYAKDMYVNLAISAKAVRLANSGGSMVNALDAEVKAAYETAKWNVGRSLFGNGKGVLANSEAVTGSTTIKVDDVKFLKEGLIIDVYETGASIPQDAGVGLRIKAVDRVAKTITVYGNTITLKAGFITVQNSYNREITGLNAIFDDSITSLYGVSKAENKIIVPTTIDGVESLEDDVLWDAVEGAQTYKNSKIDMIMMGKDAYKEYVAYLRAGNVRVESMTKEITGGFKAIQIAFGNRDIDVVYEQCVPDNEI